MAFPEGRLLALRDGWLHVLAADGWTVLGRNRPPAGAVRLSREAAEDWCEREGWHLRLLDELPAPGSSH